MIDNIYGCTAFLGKANNNSEEFCHYIWHEKGVFDALLKGLDKDIYGPDLEIILFYFFVNAKEHELAHMKLKEIENYIQSEKSIGINVIINQENFFHKNIEDRYEFLKDCIISRLELLASVIKKKNLDVKMECLKEDTIELLNSQKFQEIIIAQKSKQNG